MSDLVNLLVESEGKATSRARPLLSAAAATSTSTATTGPREGNRNSGMYHVPGCRSSNDVAERNRVHFNREAEALKAGFRKARNCD